MKNFKSIMRPAPVVRSKLNVDASISLVLNANHIVSKDRKDWKLWLIQLKLNRQLSRHDLT